MRAFGGSTAGSRVKGASDNARNLSDHHLRRIAATSGVFGMGVLWV